MPDKKKLRALIFRHGSTVLNEKNLFRGMLDIPLDEQGIIDAHDAADFALKYRHNGEKVNIERILSSPLLRSVQTAQVLSGKIGGIAVDLRRELFPWQMGSDFYGKDRDKLAEKLEFYVKNPNETPENGVCLSDFVDGVGDFFEDQLSRPCVTAFSTHTSDIISLSDLVKGVTPSHPEKAHVVKPGGIVAVFVTENGYEMEPIFKAEDKPAEFGS